MILLLELKSVKVIHLLMTTRPALRQPHCLSALGILTPAQRPQSLKGRLVWLFSQESTAAVQRCARKSTEFASGYKNAGENRGDMESSLATQDSTHREFC